MSAGLVQAAYIVAALFFIMSLAGLSKQESARNGNYYGIAGMAIALIATIFSQMLKGLVGSLSRWRSVARSVFSTPRK